MRGLLWTTVIWTITLVVLLRSGMIRPSGGRFLRREHLALVVLLLGTHSLTGSSAEEVLANPLVIERIIRGTLDTLALLLVLPLLLGRLRTSSWWGGRGLLALGGYLLVAAVSVLYSVAPFVTAGKVYELGVGLLVVWAILLSSEPRKELRETVHLVVLLEAALVAVAVVGFFLVPGTFSQIRGRPGFLTAATMGSPYAHPNGLSAAGALVAAYSTALFLVATRRAGRYAWMSLAVIGTAGTLLASGRQGLVIWTASIVILLWIHRPRLFSLLIGPISAALVISNWDTIWRIVSRQQRPSTLSTWSGRLVWWEAALDVWKEHPWTGYGYGVGGRFVALSSIERGASSLHSGYMEALVGVGILGVIPLAYAVWRMSVWSAGQLLARRDTHLAILVVPLLLHTLVSLGFGAWLNEDFILFAILVGLADLEPVRFSRLLARLAAPSRPPVRAPTPVG